MAISIWGTITMNRIESRGKPFGVFLCPHPHTRSWIDGYADMVVKKGPPLGMNYNRAQLHGRVRGWMGANTGAPFPVKTETYH